MLVLSFVFSFNFGLSAQTFEVSWTSVFSCILISSTKSADCSQDYSSVLSRLVTELPFCLDLLIFVLSFVVFFNFGLSAQTFEVFWTSVWTLHINFLQKICRLFTRFWFRLIMVGHRTSIVSWFINARIIIWIIVQFWTFKVSWTSVFSPSLFASISEKHVVETSIGQRKNKKWIKWEESNSERRGSSWTPSTSILCYKG